MKNRLILLTGFLLLAPATLGEEGMWLFNAIPKAKLKSQYNTELSVAWLDHLRLSSVQFAGQFGGEGLGSGSLVSPDGLVLAQRSAASECLRQISDSHHDYFTDGFYAGDSSHEQTCPGLELTVLRTITDVTPQVVQSSKPASGAGIGITQDAAIAGIEKTRDATTRLECHVISLYGDQIFHLYAYQRYKDVRLVFAPEAAINFGDGGAAFSDRNFNFNIAFFRIYENGRPARTTDYLHWSKSGARQGDLVLLSGSSAGDDRGDTINQLEFLRTVEYPYFLKDYRRRIAMLEDFASRSKSNAAVAAAELESLRHAEQRISGLLAVLSDGPLMHRRIMQERMLLIRSRGNPIFAADFAAIRQVDRALTVEHDIFVPYRLLEMGDGFRGRLARYARLLVRIAAEKQKPDAERLEEYRESQWPSLQSQLFAPQAISKPLEAIELTDSLAQMRETLSPTNPAVARVLAAKTPENVARDAVSQTRLDDPAFRRQLYQGGAAAVAASSDPMIVLMREIEPDARAVRQRYDREVESIIRARQAVAVKRQAQQHGYDFAPEPTSSLRLSYGRVKGYIESGAQPKATPTPAAAFITFGDVFKAASQHQAQPPYTLPNSWTKQKSKLALDVPLTFFSTADIGEGSEGAPAVNQAGEIVGMVIGGNRQALAWRFQYDDASGRAIALDSRGILQALEKVYKAKALVKEITADK